MAYTQSDLNYYKKNPSHITADLDMELLVALIDFDAQNIKYVKPQTFELIQAAYNNDPSVFKYIDFSKVTIQFLEQAIYATPVMIQHIYSPSPELMKLALSRDLNTLQYIEKYLDEAMYIWLLEQNGLILEHIPAGKQTEDMIRVAIHENMEAYKYAHIKTKEFDMYIIDQDPKRIDMVSQYWPELIIPLVKYNPRFIVKFFNQPELITQEIKKIAIAQEPMVFRIIPDPDLDLMKYTIDLDFDMMEYMPYNQELVDYAIARNGLALKYVRKKDLRTIKNAIRQNVKALDYVEYHRQFLIDYAFAQDGIALQYVINPTYDQCLDAVKRNAFAVQFVPAELRTKELQLYALMGGVEVLPYLGEPADDEVILQVLRLEPSYIFEVENPTESMYITAFGATGRLIMFFLDWNDKFSDDVIAAALGQDGTIFEFVKYKTKKLALVAIQQYPAALQWVDFQDTEIATAAVELDPKTLFFVDRDVMDSQLLAMAISLDPAYFTRTEGELTWEQWIELAGLNN